MKHDRHQLSQEEESDSRLSNKAISTKQTELEASTTNPDLLRIVQGLALKEKTLDTIFKTHQLAIIDHTDGEEGLVAEQQALDDHDDSISELTIRIQRLISSVIPSSTDELRKASTRHLTRLQENRCYYPKEATITSMQLHGFSDASKRAYSGVIYI